MKELPLTALTPGQKAKVISVNSAGATGKRIMEMGLVPGTLLKVERFAPLGDPIEISFKGYKLSLRNDEAARIYVRVVTDE